MTLSVVEKVNTFSTTNCPPTSAMMLMKTEPAIKYECLYVFRAKKWITPYLNWILPFFWYLSNKFDEIGKIIPQIGLEITENRLNNQKIRHYLDEVPD